MASLGEFRFKHINIENKICLQFDSKTFSVNSAYFRKSVSTLLLLEHSTIGIMWLYM